MPADSKLEVKGIEVMKSAFIENSYNDNEFQLHVTRVDIHINEQMAGKPGLISSPHTPDF